MISNLSLRLYAHTEPDEETEVQSSVEPMSNAKTPLQTEEELTKIFVDNLATLHQAMVLFGRYTCKALNPQCQECFLSHLCKSKTSYKC